MECGGGGGIMMLHPWREELRERSGERDKVGRKEAHDKKKLRRIFVF